MVAFSYSGDAKTWKKDYGIQRVIFMLLHGGDKYAVAGEGGTITSESGSNEPEFHHQNTLYGIVDGEKFVWLEKRQQFYFL